MTADDSDRDADRRLFREAVRGVKRLKTALPPPARKPKPKPKARFTRMDEHGMLAESLQLSPGDLFVENGEEVSFRRAHVAQKVLEKLRRGQYRVEAEADLHGLNVTQAKQMLREFLQAMRKERIACVRVIHGKGRRSGNHGPVLKPAVQVVLQKLDAVAAYASARPVDGGTGAMYVLLQW